MGLGITPLETLMTDFCAENNAETGRPSLYNRYPVSEEQDFRRIQNRTTVLKIIYVIVLYTRLVCVCFLGL